MGGANIAVYRPKDCVCVAEFVKAMVADNVFK